MKFKKTQLLYYLYFFSMGIGVSAALHNDRKTLSAVLLHVF